MRPRIQATVLILASLAASMPSLPRNALAQQNSAAPPPDAPYLRVDPSQLPPLPPVIPSSERQQMVLMATGAGAAIGILVVDLVSGGLLLAPLGIPGADALLRLGAGGGAVAAPTYSFVQRGLAVIATAASAIGGGYIGSYVAKSRPDFVRLGP